MLLYVLFFTVRVVFNRSMKSSIFIDSLTSKKRPRIIAGSFKISK